MAVPMLPRTDDEIRAAMHKALDQELDRELADGNWRHMSVRLSIGVDTVLTSTTMTERIPRE